MFKNESDTSTHLVRLFFWVLVCAAALAVKPTLAATASDTNVARGSKLIGSRVEIPVFGEQLFAQSRMTSGGAVPSSYKIIPGDRLSIQFFGGFSKSFEGIVDDDGEIFVPDVGPIQVAGVSLNEVQPLIQKHVLSVYKDTVQVYIRLIGPGSVGVFVSGGVPYPGKYYGAAGDGLLYFLSIAGGVDSSLGSYRNIEVLRNGKVIKSFDLYDFVRRGTTPSIQLKPNDAIFVPEQGPLVLVTGTVRSEWFVELNKHSGLGIEALEIARPVVGAKQVAVTGIRNDQPIAYYMEIEKFKNFHLVDGDRIEFRGDDVAQSIAVKVEANINTPAVLNLPRDATLAEVLASIEVNNSFADPGSIYIRRISIAKAQKEAMSRSLDQLERDLLSASSISTEEARLRADEASRLSKFIERAKDIEPEGILVVSDKRQLSNIRLLEGDVIVIPDRVETILVVGEVYSPGGFAYTARTRAIDYIKQAGGFTQSANHGHLVVRQSNGVSRRVTTGYLVQPGDQLLVVPNVDRKFFVLSKDISQLLFQIALTTATVLRL